MEEKILIQSKEQLNTKKCSILILVGFLLATFLTLLIYSIYEWGDSYWGWSILLIIDAFEMIWFVAVPLLVIGVVLSAGIYFSSSEITVTDKRVFGKGLFGKRVDLPVDSVSAIATNSFLKAVIVSTSSGSIRFFWLKNYEEIYSIVSKILLKRQDNRIAENKTVVQNIELSNADELKKYKELLDTGVITQEEFDAKKKQLLGL